ncbi:hypothetical protein I314_06772 [Cryptococcus bacillisporus CA1873]|uniref:BAH domain-containing protein n=1 Tax=Cryptococcus bacillisporus CA1873 TaxID=1296111 RepID=A0ABR5B1I4_CRYGA|nr:hypothetical protein I314_06772 [Cryptococcus bacillisporus CA1873]|eukprot:KIR57452.1 hypothetical protein I314_06772 [Cryptococcus gattii CA1873]
MSQSKRARDLAPLSWEAPSEEEYKSLKRYKSFLMPPNISYYLGDFVWLAHEHSRPPIPESPPRKKSRASHAARTAAEKEEDEEEDDEEDEETEEEKQRREADAMWKAGYWIGRIVEIRARDKTYVWMKIRWMCRTVKELRESDVKTGLPKGKVGGREIFMLGREFDAVQPVGTVESHAPVTLYDESNPMQEPFDNKTIFYRSEARTPTLEESAVIQAKANPTKATSKRARQSDISSSRHLFQYQPPTCYCAEPYLPITDRPESMALCPNPGCLKWFHLGCLDWRGGDYRRPLTPFSISYIRSAGLQLLSLADYTYSSDVQSDVIRPLTPGKPFWEVVNGTPTQKEIEKAREEGLAECQNEYAEQYSQESDKVKQEKEGVLSFAELQAWAIQVDERIPEVIQQAAISPILRGEKAGVVGNARKVLEARQIISIAANPSIYAISVHSAVDNNVEGKSERNGDDAIGKRAADGTIEVAEEDESRPSIPQMVEDWLMTHGDNLDENETRTVVWRCPSCSRFI